MVGNHGDGIVEPHDLAHALHSLGRGIVDALHATPEYWRLREGSDLHAGRPDIDAVDGRSVDLGRGVETFGRGADQLEILWSLELDAGRHGQPRRIGGELAIRDTSAGRRVNHFAALGATTRRIDFPALRRRGHQHGWATAPASRSGCHAPRIAFELPVACTPSSGLK